MPEDIPLVYYACISLDGRLPHWQARCTCGWQGEERLADSEREAEQQAKELATCHSIESGHQPVWEEKWKDV